MNGGSETRAADMPVTGEATAARVRERLAWIDALKGIGIVAVVAGHVWTRGALHNAIYAFHMPLFFMLSGAVARPMPMRLLAPRLLRSLGLPFLSFSILLLSADFLIEGLRGMRPIFPSFAAGAQAILFATERLPGPFAIFWFAPCLLIARLLWNAVLATGWTLRSRAMLLAMLGVALAALLADRLGTRSPIGLLPVPAAVLLLWIGALWKGWSPTKMVSAIMLGIALLGLFVFPPVNLRAADLGWPVLSLAGAVAITDWLGRGIKRLPPWAVQLLVWLGRRSLVIMFAHTAFIHYLTPYLPHGPRFLTALAGALLVDWLARLTAPGRLFLLGERS